MKSVDALLFLLFVFVLYTKFIVFVQPSFFGNTDFDIRITNGLSNNSSSSRLTVLCVPNDGGDIGGRALQERDEFYSWVVKFSNLFWGRSRVFVCTVKRGDKRMQFEAFRASRDRSRCGGGEKCSWLVKEDGFYFSNNGFNWIKNFPWM